MCGYKCVALIYKWSETNFVLHINNALKKLILTWDNGSQICLVKSAKLYQYILSSGCVCDG